MITSYVWRKGQEASLLPLLHAYFVRVAEGTRSFQNLVPFSLREKKKPRDQGPAAFSSWRKGQDSNLRGVNLPVFKTGALNHSATLPRLIITRGRGEGKLGSGFRLGADGSGAGEGAGVVKVNRGKVGKLLAEHAYGLQSEPNSVR